LPVDRVDETRVLSADDLAFEFCLNALRLVAGFDAELFEARTGLPWSVLAAPLAAARAKGLVMLGADRKLAPTTLGRQFLNDLQAIFLPADPQPGRSGRRGVLAMPGTIG
jgi:oxygen-independent coproporphyrinogen-3 oxidase